ncbi:hypothetical protein AB1Y20_004264 [Prymnesium parvum]|uniref:EF-hand domain-containing protein n=1 Tax=Prymnesium parvum TaxID=97485 RepID=A0AB34J745_PRYPA
MEMLTITAPPHATSGQEISFQTVDGRMFRAVIPPGVRPGDLFNLQVPLATPSAPAVPAAAGEMVPMGLPVDEAPREGTRTAFTAVRSSVAAVHAECPISFNPLHKGPVGVFVNREGRRVSPHFYSLEGARKWLESGTGTCPLTRQPIHSVVQVPNVNDDPEGWFRVVDFTGDGRLSRKEAIDALKAQLPTDNVLLDAALADPNHWMWQQWDVDGSGFIEKEEILAPNGLANYVRSQCSQREEEDVPDIRDKRAWYDFWDKDGSGSLEKEEVVRALVKTLKLTHDPARVQVMRSTIECTWGIFDPDGSGSIDRNEFLLPGDGLADMILATVQYNGT